MTKHILMSHARFVIPLARAIHEACPDIVFVPLQASLTKILGELEMPMRQLGEFVTPEIRDDAFARAASVLRDIQEFHDYPDYLDPGVRRFISQRATSFFYPRLGDLALMALTLDQANIDLVLVHNDVEPATRLACMWARAHNVPALHVPHAIYHDNKDRPSLDIHDMVTATHLTASSGYQAQWYARRAPELRIVITGLPQFDPWVTKSLDRARAMQLLDLEPGRPVITYASSWRQDTNLAGCHDGVEDTYANFLTAAKNMPPEFQFIITVNPTGQNLEFHAQKAHEIGVPCIVTDRYLDQLLIASDVVLSYGPSNLLLEAAHVPWLRLITTDGYYDDPEILKTGTEPSQITEAIRTALATPPAPRNRLFDKYLGPRDGQATNRIAQVVRELLCHTPSP